MLIVQYRNFFALRADENGVSNIKHIFFLRASRGLRFTSLLVLCGGDLDEMIDFKRKKMAWHRSIFISAKIDGGDVEEIDHFQIEKLRSHGNIFHIIVNFV